MEVNLTVVAGALLMTDPGAKARDDLLGLSLYAQLAADKKGNTAAPPFTRHDDPVSWHRYNIAALKNFGMLLPATDELTFTALPGEVRTLVQWLELQPSSAPARALLQLARLPEDAPALKRLQSRILARDATGSRLTLLLQCLNGEGSFESWFVTLHAAQPLGPNVFSQPIDGGSLLSEVHISHRAGRLGADHDQFRTLLAQKIEPVRQANVLTIDSPQTTGDTP